MRGLCAFESNDLYELLLSLTRSNFYYQDDLTGHIDTSKMFENVVEKCVPWNAYVRFRTHFADFVGRSVFHCHLLFHEDHGMMGVFDIVDAQGKGAGPDQRLPTHSH